MSKISTSRRDFIRSLALGAAVLPWAKSFAASAAPALPHLAITDPAAQSLGYIENAAKLDPAKESAFKKGSKCSQCTLYQGAQASGGYAPCAVFPGKAVNAKGWCRAFAAKA